MWEQHNLGSNQLDLLADIQRENQAQMRAEVLREHRVKGAAPSQDRAHVRRRRALAGALVGACLLAFVLA